MLYQHYEYDQRGLLTDVYVSTGGSYDPQTDAPEVTYTYKPTGAIDKIVYKGGREADYEYTIRDWVESINNVNSPGGTFAAFYDYTDNGNISSSIFHNPDIDLNASHNTYRYDYSYDGLSRLTGADYRFGDGTPADAFDVQGLTYDAAGNIESLRRRDEGGSWIDDLTYQYQSGRNRLQSVTDAAGQQHDWDAFSSSFAYDANGNMTSQTGKINNIIYEQRNLPTRFEMNGGGSLLAAYNAEGQRILKETSGGAWQFYVMDGQQILAVVDQSGFSHFNLVGNDVFGRYDNSGARRYYVKDHLGSTRAVVNDNGTVLDTFDYYPFGLIMPGRETDATGTIEKFTGKERDTEGNLNLDYFGARYYDAAVGRWHGVDPLTDQYPGISPYVYALNNPLIFVDPDGREVKCSNQEQCERLVSDIQELYGDASVGFEQRTQTRRTWFGLGPEKTTEYYAITVDDESDFNWSQDDYASALYDAIVSEDVVFNVFYQKRGPWGNLENVDYQDAGGGYFQRTSNNRVANVFVDPRGYQRVGDSSSIILMHEMIGHGHPVATPTAQNSLNAHDINRFYRAKLGLNPNVSYRTSHPGYQRKNISWPRTGFYRRN